MIQKLAEFKALIEFCYLSEVDAVYLSSTNVNGTCSLFVFRNCSICFCARKYSNSLPQLFKQDAIKTEFSRQHVNS